MPNYYNPYAYAGQQFQAPVMPQAQAPQPQPQQQMQMPMQIQNGGFVSVRNETEARNYPVALGNSVTFKDETAPYIYTKTMGFSQLDAPKFDKYKLVKETPAEQPKLLQDEVFDDKPILDTIDHLKGEIQAIWGEIEGLKKKPASKAKKEADNERHDDHA